MDNGHVTCGHTKYGLWGEENLVIGFAPLPHFRNASAIAGPGLGVSTRRRPRLVSRAEESRFSL